MPDSRSSSDFCSMKSCRCQTAHVGERRAVAGAGATGEQVASKQSQRATCRGYYSCCALLLRFCSLLHYKSVMSGFLSTWVGLLSNRVGLLSNGVGLFSREKILENTPTPLFEQPLKFIAHGCIFERLLYNLLVSMRAVFQRAMHEK